MSWSINLSGSKEMVDAELDAAQCVLAGAREAVLKNKCDLVSVSLSGSAYSSPDGTGGGGASFSVSGYIPTPPPPPVRDEAAQQSDPIAV